jgi:outer membrane lipoprotein LolB
MGRVLLAICGAMLLAGCATTRPAHEPLVAAAQEALLLELPGYQFEGRAAVRVGEDGSSPAVSWVQRGSESRLRLTGPFGTGGLILRYGPDSLHITSSRGDEYAGDEADAILSGQLGFVPPFDALRYWVLGLAAPGDAPTELQTNAAGRVAEMTQLGWRIRYERWTALATRSGEVQLPELLMATRGEIRLKLVVNRWKLRAD